MKAIECARGWLLWISIAVLVPSVCAYTWASNAVANWRTVRRYRSGRRDRLAKLRASGRGSARR